MKPYDIKAIKNENFLIANQQEIHFIEYDFFILFSSNRLTEKMYDWKQIFNEILETVIRLFFSFFSNSTKYSWKYFSTFFCEKF